MMITWWPYYTVRSLFNRVWPNSYMVRKYASGSVSRRLMSSRASWPDRVYMTSTYACYEYTVSNPRDRVWNANVRIAWCRTRGAGRSENAVEYWIGFWKLFFFSFSGAVDTKINNTSMYIIEISNFNTRSNNLSIWFVHIIVIVSYQ